jgi:tyrosyl-tRNA synthetase
VFSVNRMLAAEAYKLRLEKGLSFIEFNYQLLQAYDFLELFRRYGCRLQMGGDDQFGNIVAGTDLIRRKEGAQAYGLTCPLLTTATGAKMGKTASGAVWLDKDKLSAFDFYQYWVNCDDRDVGRFLRLYTFLDLEEIEGLENLVGADIRDAKHRLAWEVTALVHGAVEADLARKAARDMVAGEATEALPTVSLGADELASGIGLLTLLVRAGLTASNGEGRRLVQGGGVKLDNERVDDPNLVLTSLPDGGSVVRVGKKRSVRLVAG